MQEQSPKRLFQVSAWQAARRPLAQSPAGPPANWLVSGPRAGALVAVWVTIPPNKLHHRALLQVRGKLYELLVNCIPPEVRQVAGQRGSVRVWEPGQA